MFTDKALENYFHKMVGKLFKILPLKECGDGTVNIYVRSLLVELSGLSALECLEEQPYYITIVSIVAHFAKDIETCSVHDVKRDVFAAIDACKKVEKYYGGGKDDCS